MACEITLGRLLPCKDGIGGIFDLYFINYGATFVIDGTTGEVTDINDGEAVPGAVTMYKWKVKGATNLEQTVTTSRDAGTTFWSQVLNATFTKLDSATQKQLKLMAWGRPHVIVVDNNGNAYACGIDDGMEVTGGTIVTGTAKGDLSGFTLVMTGEEQLPAPFIESATKADPFGGLTTAPTIVDGV